MALNALIIGGSRGIGLAIGRKFLENSYNLILISRNTDNHLINGVNLLKNYQQTKLCDNTNDINYHICDLTNENNLIETCEEIIKKYKQIDVLINSAGITMNKLLISTKIEDIHKLININMIGTILMTKFICKQMLRQKNGGSIINIGSVVGECGNVGQTIYSSTKSSLIGFTKSLAKELYQKNIRVNLVSPGFIQTDMTAMNMKKEQIDNYEKIIPLQRFGTADEIANVVYFLASSSFITGTIINVDGGLNLI